MNNNLLSHSIPWSKKDGDNIRKEAIKKSSSNTFPPRKNSTAYSLRLAYPQCDGWVRIHVQLGWIVPKHVLRATLQANTGYSKLLARDLLTWPQEDAIPRNIENENYIEVK